jgi:hypothetical protein
MSSGPLAHVALLVLVLGLGLFEATSAVVRTHLRVSSVSWDSPITQHIDELAMEAMPSADPAGESVARARPSGDGRPVAPPADPPLASPALSSGITRSPPTA